LVWQIMQQLKLLNDTIFKNNISLNMK